MLLKSYNQISKKKCRNFRIFIVKKFSNYNYIMIFKIKINISYFL